MLQKQIFEIIRYYLYKIVTILFKLKVFATFLMVAKKCCKDFEKPDKCCKVNVARFLALSKILQNSCCKNFGNFCNIFFSNVAKKKTYEWGWGALEGVL